MTSMWTRTTGTILIADDEPLARRTLRSHLDELGCKGSIEQAADGKAAAALAIKHRPGLIFLDIVMPGATGLEVLEQIDYEPKVIFTTAHDEYAVTAFELGALDYVLKPFGKERLNRAIDRAEAALNTSATPLLARARESLQSAAPLSRIFVRDGTRILPIDLASIERIRGADDYATIITRTKEYLVSIRLSDLESRLSSAHFLRIHRSHLINLAYVTSIESCDAARLEVAMKSGATIVASRTGSKRLRELTL
jgi:two-component system LytT family response regulator